MPFTQPDAARNRGLVLDTERATEWLVRVASRGVVHHHVLPEGGRSCMSWRGHASPAHAEPDEKSGQTTLGLDTRLVTIRGGAQRRLESDWTA